MLDIFSWALTFPGWLATMIVAAMPVLEIRGALPFALEILGIPFWEAYLFSVIGNILPAIILVYGLRRISDFLESRSKIMTR
ncbi:MAG: small multi-drug export protein, partial [bacterium]|nr:small multi-drug export protein [bacterium]